MKLNKEKTKLNSFESFLFFFILRFLFSFTLLFRSKYKHIIAFLSPVSFSVLFGLEIISNSIRNSNNIFVNSFILFKLSLNDDQF